MATPSSSSSKKKKVSNGKQALSSEDLPSTMTDGIELNDKIQGRASPSSAGPQQEQQHSTNEDATADDSHRTVVAASNEDNESNSVTLKEAVAEEEEGVLSHTTFAQLGVVETLVEACDRLQWPTATQIQKQIIPEALVGRDVIGLAETGSGKTAAFVLPVLQQLLKNPVRATACIILAPTRELAIQIHQVCQALGSGVGATSCCVVGGIDRTSQAIALARLPHIVIATPGRLLDHLRDTKGFQLRQVRYLILDEADRMLSLDFEQELHAILDELPSQRQTMLFSATMTSQVQKLERASLKDPVRIQVSANKFQTPQQLLQQYMFIPAKYKDCYLTFIVNEHAGQSILIFAATCHNVQRLALTLRNLGFPAVALHGQMRQSARLGALQKFASGGRTILVCTDVAARGLDLPVVDMVINFDLPGHGKEYVHRVGRTARAGKAGRAVALVTQYDVEVYQRLEQLLQQKLPAYPIPDEATVLILLERVSDAQRRATRELKEQLAAAKNGGGGRRNLNKRGRGHDDNGEEDNAQDVLHRQVVKGYMGGSGGRGGALPNQRNGNGNKKKKYSRQR